MSTQPPIKGPLETHLAPVLDDGRIQRIGRAVQASRHLLASRPAWRLAVAGAAVAGLALVAWLARPVEAQPLGLADGTPLPVLLAASESGRKLALSDGSVVSLEADAAAEVVANQAARLTMLMRQGRARFEVNPKAHRQWLVEAGVATVEVVGTIFTVDRSAEGVRVAVERGIVVVRSERLPDHLVRLEAGQSTFVKADVAAPPVEVNPEPVPAPLTVSGSAIHPAPLLTPQPWRRAATAGDYSTAWAALEKLGFASVVARTTASDELLALADTARSTGHDAAAAEALKRLLAIAPRDANAATAAFTLGRLELEKLQRPGDAARHFAQAAAAPALGPLAEDALARRVEALWTAGQKDDALAAARQALERFPKGTHAAQLQRWLADPAHDTPWAR